MLELADTYEASVAATGLRLVRFWPEPTLLLTLEPVVRKAERHDPAATRGSRVLAQPPRQEAGVSKGYLWNLEKGETDGRPSGRTLYQIARALGTSKKAAGSTHFEWLALTSRSTDICLHMK